MTDTSTTPQKESAASSAPSKNALKKAAKLAKKAAKGNGNMKAPDDSQGGPSTHRVTIPKASDVPNGQEAKANSGPSMYLDGEGFAALKCLAAARLFNVNVEIVETSPAGGFSFASGCVVAVGSTLIFGQNAICRYFSYAGRPGSLQGGEALPVDVEEWMEWEASTLAIAEQSIAEARKVGSAPSSEVLAAFQYLEEKLTGQWLTNTVRDLRYPVAFVIRRGISPGQVAREAIERGSRATCSSTYMVKDLYTIEDQRQPKPDLWLSKGFGYLKST